ncbi:MAG: hypothetical protein ACR2IK_01495 [Chloroflexota bacterium]
MIPRRSQRFLLALTSAFLIIGSMSTAALADQRDFNINNTIDYVLAHAYVSAASDPQWGDDILGKDVLNPGEAWRVGFNRGDGSTCIWDVKVVTLDGIEVKFPAVDLCTVTDVTVHN